jgi:hypothetical protein
MRLRARGGVRVHCALANLLLFDLKVVDADKHKLFTGVDNGPILANLARAAGWGIPLTVRILVVPGLNDGPSDAQQVASCQAALRLREVELLPYHNTGSEKYHRLGWKYRLPDTPMRLWMKSPASPQHWPQRVCMWKQEHRYDRTRCAIARAEPGGETVADH